MNKIYDHFVGELPDWVIDTPDSIPSEQFIMIRKHLDKIMILDDGEIVPVSWFAQFDAMPNMTDIGKSIDGDGFFENKAYTSLSKWQEVHGETNRCFVATLDYFATGEGQTMRVIAARAWSMGEFIVSLDEDAYFVQGMSFYEGIPTTGDVAWENLRSRYVEKLILIPNGAITVDLKIHMNLS